MRLTVLQLSAAWNQHEQVLGRIDALLAGGPATDLVLLPEAALSGYVSPDLDFDLTARAESELGATFHALAALATRHRTAIVGPVVMRRDQKVYNAMIGIDAAGAHSFTYAKRHPWHPEAWASAGAGAMPVVQLAGRKLTIAICYDIQFVDDDPQDALRAADLLLFPSAWVDSDSTRLALLSALARRFQLWIANANWSAGDVVIDGQEESCIIAPSGKIVANAGLGERRIDARLPPA